MDPYIFSMLGGMEKNKTVWSNPYYNIQLYFINLERPDQMLMDHFYFFPERWKAKSCSR